MIENSHDIIKNENEEDKEIHHSGISKKKLSFFYFVYFLKSLLYLFGFHFLYSVLTLPII